MNTNSSTNENNSANNAPEAILFKTNWSHEFNILRKVLKYSPGFRLIIAEFNDPHFRLELIKELSKHFPTTTTLYLDPEKHHTFALFEEELFQLSKTFTIIHILNLDNWLFDEKEDRFKGFNYHREYIANRCQSSILLWMTEPVIAKFITNAPDMWSWHTTLLSFNIKNPLHNAEFPVELKYTEGYRLQIRKQRIKNLSDYLHNVQKPISDKERAEFLNELTTLYTGTYNYTDASKCSNNTLHIVETLNNPEIIITTLTNLGDLLTAQNEYHKAINAFEKCLKKTEEIDDYISKPYVLERLGYLFYKLKDKNTAIKFLNQSLQHASQNILKPHMIQVYCQFANIYIAEEDLPKAMENCNQALIIAEKMEIDPYKATVLHKISVIHQKKGDFLKACDTYSSIITILKKSGNKYNICKSLNQLGTLFLINSNLQEATAKFQESLKITEEEGDEINSAFALRGLGRTYNKLDNYKEALQTFNRCLLLFQNLNRPEQTGVIREIDKIINSKEYLLNNKPSIKTPQEINMEQKPKTKQFNGILALMDLVDFTPQSLKLGDHITAQFLTGFYEKCRKIIEKNGFEYVKAIGDAILFFGKEPEELLKIMISIFTEDHFKDSHGFEVNIRMIAHSSYFRFFLDENGNKIDAVGSETIRTFRIEKWGESSQLLVTENLFRGVQDLLDQNKIKSVEKIWNEPIKGFEPFGDVTVTHSLIPPELDEDSQNLLSPLFTQRQNNLFERVKKIPVFSNLYEPIDMEKNFIDISLKKDWNKGSKQGPFRKLERYKNRTEIEEEWRKSVENLEVNNIRIRAKELLTRFNKGFIFGLPGAGKTTILNHLAFQTLSAPHNRSVIIVNCKDIEENDVTILHKEYSTNKAIHLLFSKFMSINNNEQNSHSAKSNSHNEQKELEKAFKHVYKLWLDGKLIILIDALDESPCEEVKQAIVDLCAKLMNDIKTAEQHPGDAPQNQLFISSRPGEFERICKLSEPVFDVNPLDMGQMRHMARRLYGEESEMYKLFDDRIWKEPVVKKMGGTPLTAMLLLIYFETYGRFDMRYHTYDLLIKFILCRAWDMIKAEEFKMRYRDLSYFFDQAASPDFLEKNSDANQQYEALCKLAFNALFDTRSGKVERELEEDEFLEHFKQSLMKFSNNPELSNNETKATEAAKEWFLFLKREHLLISLGHKKYLFIHSTVMEFLAARSLVIERSKNISKWKALIELTINKPANHILETLPISCGYSYEYGNDILKEIRKTFENENKTITIAFRCLSETEAAEKIKLDALKTRTLYQQKLDEINKNKEAKEWIYASLKKLLFSEQEEKVVGAIEIFKTVIPLCRDTFVADYLDENEKTNLTEARESLIKVLVDDNVFRELEELANTITKPEDISPIIEHQKNNTESLLTFNLPNSADDKNFQYYKKHMGITLKGFYGSPNMKHSKGITAAVFSPDGQYFLSASSDNTLKLWETDSGREIRTFRGHSAEIWACQFSHNSKYILSASCDKTLKLWDTNSGREIRTFSGHTNYVLACQFSFDNKYILSASSDETLKLWETNSGREIRNFKGHNNIVVACQFSPNEEYILSASWDNTLKLWDKNSAREIRTFKGHKDFVWDCQFTPDGKYILSASEDKKLKLWETDSAREISEFKGHKGEVMACQFSSNGEYILSASRDNTLKLCDTNSANEIGYFEGHKNYVMACQFSIDENYILSASADNTLKLWDKNSAKEIKKFNGHESGVSACQFSQNGKYIISASKDNTVKFWETNSGKEIKQFKGHENNVTACQFSQDGKYIILASADNTLKLWETNSDKVIRTFKGHESSVNACQFSHNDKYILSASSDKTMKLWQTDSSKEITTFKGHESSVNACQFSHDDKNILSASNDKTLKLWEVDSPNEIRTFKGHKENVKACQFSHDDKYILSASDDKTLILWERDSAKEITVFAGHKNPVTTCQFSHNDRYTLSASEDNTLKIWDKESGKEIKTIQLLWIAFHIAISPINPNIIITANGNGTVTMFDLSSIVG